jgi:hypothetical protein
VHASQIVCQCLIRERDNDDEIIFDQNIIGRYVEGRFPPFRVEQGNLVAYDADRIR